MALAAVAGHCVAIVKMRVLEKLIPNQSLFSLNGTRLSLAKLYVTHSKDERGSESGFRILSNLFILNNMAERVGLKT